MIPARPIVWASKIEDPLRESIFGSDPGGSHNEASSSADSDPMKCEKVPPPAPKFARGIPNRALRFGSVAANKINLHPTREEDTSEPDRQLLCIIASSGLTLGCTSNGRRDNAGR